MGWKVQIVILNRVGLGRLMEKETFEFNTQFPYHPFLCPSLFLPQAKFCLYSCCLPDNILENLGTYLYCPVCRTGYIICRAQQKRKISTPCSKVITDFKSATTEH